LKDFALASPHSASRPLSPHLSIWKPGVHMVASITHRITGDGMATVGTALFVWWLLSIAAGPAAYATFVDCFTYASGQLNILGYVFGIGLTLAFFQHMASGIRHLVMDTGAGFELRSNRIWASMTFVASLLLTSAYWAYLLVGK